MVEANQQLLRRYRTIATWGGAAFGGIVAAGAAGSAGLHSPFGGFAFVYLLVLACAVGALIGFVFFELVIARLIAGPGAGSWSAGGAASGGFGGGGSDGGGDGGGGGK